MTDNVRHVDFTPRDRAFRVEPRLRALDLRIQGDVTGRDPSEPFDSTAYWLDFVKPRGNELVGWDRETPTPANDDEAWLCSTEAWEAVMRPWIRLIGEVEQAHEEWRTANGLDEVAS